MIAADPRLFADRLIVIDTETTGFDPVAGDRICEIGAVELVRCLPSGREFQVYLNPGRSSHPRALEVHGLSDAFLADKPRFEAVCRDFLAFVGDACLIAHNAQFDLNFLNFELRRCGRDPLPPERAICTAELGRARYPGAQNSLDALCDRFGVSRAKRVRHGALLDCQLLADVYIELIGGRQIGLGLAAPLAAERTQFAAAPAPVPRGRMPRPHAASDAELLRHAAFLGRLADPIWSRAAAATI